MNTYDTPLYNSRFEHDNCGIGAVVQIDGTKTHQCVHDALQIVERMQHRAGSDADEQSGDGVGILTQIPHAYFTSLHLLSFQLPAADDYAVGMLFLPQDSTKAQAAKFIFEANVKSCQLTLLGWRDVPSNSSVLGSQAKAKMPLIQQVFIARPSHVSSGKAFEQKLYHLRRLFEHNQNNTYVCSLSSKTIVYKGMFLVDQLRSFYLDLQHPLFTSAIALVHSRFSTNTFPSWERAHPNRFSVHNGEINTIQGNADRMLAREETMHSKVYTKAQLATIYPIVERSGSDSAMLDNTLEFFTMQGMPLEKAAMITIPQPWQQQKNISSELKDFYEYYATMMEPWDGPASILFSDGTLFGAILDRNGLRPSRYYITKDQRLILASEVGVLELDPEEVIKKERLRPGKMLLVDTVKQTIIEDDDLKAHFANQHSYGEWIDQQLLHLKDLPIPNQSIPQYNRAQRLQLMQSFGYTYEHLQDIIVPMALNGQEGSVSMGIDTPLAVLSSVYRPLFSYFKQRFAQVTNPPIDAIREQCVTSTSVYLGSDGNLLCEDKRNCNVLKINNPILTNTDLLKIREMKQTGFNVATISLLYFKHQSLQQAIEALLVEVDRCYHHGANMLILSDRGVDTTHLAIPSLLAVSSVAKHCVKTKKRTALSLILESGEPCDVHDFATLLGYGASAINPYLAFEAIQECIDNGSLQKDAYVAIDSYSKAIRKGIITIASKMGISTIQSYQGSQNFEAIGLDQQLVDRYFSGTVSRIGGLSIEKLTQLRRDLHEQAYDPLQLATQISLPSVGYHKARGQGEQHLYNPKTILLLQQAVRTNDTALFSQFANEVDTQTRSIRQLFTFKKTTPIPLECVEPVECIVKRFKTGAMSYGSISKEAHSTLAIAMNRLQGKSNSGEGGEDSKRLATYHQQDSTCSSIKQIASGRFGVTLPYLLHASELQIKMAQGAKPGEGGHLPGKKVYPWIANTRHSTAGVSLISPPPHHDIYSIEDLAQLIFDLKNVNQASSISVKLVSEAGVGTIAAGVVKAGAHVVLVSGYDGGSGAAHRSSIQNAGMPWELGLAETHQTLVRNQLRDRVRLEVDGKLLTGRDIAIAALLGAEEFGFATTPLIALGCVMMRVCNNDTCPVGIATQNPKLRANFKGKPEYVENFMRLIAQDLRVIMATLGIARVDDLIGRTDLLSQDETLSKQYGITLDALLPKQPANIFATKRITDNNLTNCLDYTTLIPNFSPYIKKKTPYSHSICVNATTRCIGTQLGVKIYQQHPNATDHMYTVSCFGGAGQSFGAFIPKGLTLYLEGDASDYLGKGLSGGIIIVTPPKRAHIQAEENIIVGNVILYGATSGRVFINGIAGERFAVRNSGASAVVEGVGDHGCEYMTGGTVVVLGGVGNNFAAGMSGGVAYVLDAQNKLYRNVNKELVGMESLQPQDEDTLYTLLEEHVQTTKSKNASRILANFETEKCKFKKIIPHAYQAMKTEVQRQQAKGLSQQQAAWEAFVALQG
ncbi:MAG: glutamate synthase large subunit [Erysipelotrichaceae bacterium]